MVGGFVYLSYHFCCSPALGWDKFCVNSDLSRVPNPSKLLAFPTVANQASTGQACQSLPLVTCEGRQFNLIMSFLVILLGGISQQMILENGKIRLPVWFSERVTLVCRTGRVSFMPCEAKKRLTQNWTLDYPQKTWKYFQWIRNQDFFCKDSYSKWIFSTNTW